MKGFRFSLIFLFGKRNGETNTFPRSDWPGDGSVQYQGNIHWDSILHGGIHSEYTVEDHHKYIMKQYQANIHWDSILHGGIHSGRSSQIHDETI